MEKINLPNRISSIGDNWQTVAQKLANNIDYLAQLVTRLITKDNVVTEITKAQLDALVAANGLNEGLQYKVTDKGYNALATSANTYVITGAIPYKKWIGLLNIAFPVDVPVFTAIELENTLGGDLVWSRDSEGVYYGTLVGAFPANKFFLPNFLVLADLNNLENGQIGILERVTDDIVMLNVTNGEGMNTDLWGSYTVFVEIRVYY